MRKGECLDWYVFERGNVRVVHWLKVLTGVTRKYNKLNELYKIKKKN